MPPLRIRAGKNKLLLVFPSVLGHIESAVNTVINYLRSQRLWGLLDAFAFELVLREGLTNAIEHGNHGDVSRNVTLLLSISANKLEINITDEGRGFDLAALTPSEQNPLTNHRGRGIPLMQNYGFNPSYNAVGNQLNLSKQFPEPVLKG